AGLGNGADPGSPAAAPAPARSRVGMVAPPERADRAHWDGRRLPDDASNGDATGGRASRERAADRRGAKRRRGGWWARAGGGWLEHGRRRPAHPPLRGATWAPGHADSGLPADGAGGARAAQRRAAGGAGLDGGTGLPGVDWLADVAGVARPVH